MRKLLSVFLGSSLLLWLLPVANFAQSPAPQTPPQRLKIGLVLSGGGARGIAHVGVLEWFEKHRIPVDYIAGTSMGGLIGGVYAMGMKPEEMRPFLKSLNWDELLSSGPDFAQLAYRRKEDKRQFQVGVELGYRKGLALPLGISSAHYIGLLLDRLTLPYADLASFDELPVPYRCVATDFLAAKPVTLKDGPLNTALRATMSIPGVFPPVERNGAVLVDGALLNNIPTDVIREFKPDVVIAVDIGSKLGDWQKVTSLPGILQQSLTVMTIDNDRRNLRLADILIAPELGDLSLLDFSAIEKTADLGYQAAEAKAAILDKFALNESDWQSYLAARRARQRTQIATTADLQISGVGAEAQKNLQRKLGEFVGKPLPSPALDLELTKITGQGRYESLGYGVVKEAPDSDRHLLAIRVKEKPHAPPTINFGVEIDGSEVNAINFTLGGRVTLYDVGWYGAEWRNDVKLGFGNLFQTEYFKPLGKRGVFIAPRASYRRDRQGLFTGRIRLAEYQADRGGGGFDVGVLGRFAELRVGYEYARVAARSSTGASELPAVSGNVNLARIRLTYDGQNSATIPTRGFRAVAEGRWFFSAPDASADFPQFELRSSVFHPLSTRGSLFGALSGGTSFNREASVFQQFLLGGPFRFGAYDRDELRVNHYALATVGYLHRLYQMPSLVGGSVYAGGWVDHLGSSGGLTSIFDRQRQRTAASLGFVVDTKVGPVSFVGSYGEGGRGKIYFALGRFF